MNKNKITPHLHDPFLKKRPGFKGDFKFISKWPFSKYDGIFLAVPHQKFTKLKMSTFINTLKSDGIIFDFKSVLPRHKKILRW